MARYAIERQKLSDQRRGTARGRDCPRSAAPGRSTSFGAGDDAPVRRRPAGDPRGALRLAEERPGQGRQWYPRPSDPADAGRDTGRIVGRRAASFRAAGRSAALSRGALVLRDCACALCRAPMPPRRTSRDWRSALAANRATVHDLPAFKSTDIDFHFVLAEIPRNPIFPAIHDAMADWLTNQRDVTLQVAGQVQIAYRAHERIFKAIASRDPDAPEKAMAEHLKQLYRVYERVRADMRAKPVELTTSIPWLRGDCRMEHHSKPGEQKAWFGARVSWRPRAARPEERKWSSK